MIVEAGQGALAQARSLFASGVRRTFTEHGAVLDLVPPSYMRSIDDEIASMLALPDEFPGLVRAEVIGHSVEGRPLIALHVTNFADARPKPIVGIESNIHGDEIGNGPWALEMLRSTLRGHGKDPASTALLDSREFRAIPYANPDGRARVELGYLTGNGDDLFFRTNANGVDLNRNFPFAWGETTARRGSAGTGPASEPEVRAYVEYWTRHVPDVFVAGHSKGDKVLVPFGHTPVPPKDHAGLMAVAEGISRGNGYTIASSKDFTRGGTSGTSKDWMYGVHDVPSFTLEVGTTHHMSDADLAQAVARNRPAMSWFARIADAPYERAAGPGVPSATRHARGGADVLAAPEGRSGAVAGVEAYVDPLTPVGGGVELRAAGVGDAATAGSSRWVLDAEQFAGIQGGRDGVVYVRARDAQGMWGPFTAVA